MDSKIEELEELIKQNIELTQETNRIVRGMRRSARWGWFFTLVWWGVILASTGAAYYYLQPYIQQAQELYTQARDANHQAQDYGAQFADFLNQIKAKQNQQ